MSRSPRAPHGAGIAGGNSTCTSPKAVVERERHERYRPWKAPSTSLRLVPLPLRGRTVNADTA